MKEKPKNLIINFIEEILVIFAKGFVAWLPIGLFLEIIGIDLLVGTTIYTHFYEYLGAIIVVGLPIHYFIWKKKLLRIVVLGLLLSGNAYADKPLKKILDLYSNKIDNLNKSQHLFYSTELAVASRKIKEVGIPCFRSTLINKENYDKTVDCLNFRILLGEDSSEWQKYLSKIGLIAKKNRELLKNDKWVSEWNSKQFDEYGKNIKELVSNIAIMNELIEYIAE